MNTPELDPINETSPDAEPRFAVVPDTLAGRRFDAVLDGKVVRGRDAVRGGESVSLIVVLDIQTTAAPEDIPLDVLYEDEAVFVLDKPAGLVVHPGAGNPTGTLVNALLHRDPSLAALRRAVIVHR